MDELMKKDSSETSRELADILKSFEDDLIGMTVRGANKRGVFL